MTLPGAGGAGSGASPRVAQVAGGGPLLGHVKVPGDKSVSHRALLLAALAEGTSRLRGLSRGDDVSRTRLAIEALGAVVDRGPAGEVGEVVHGGRSKLHEPERPLDLGNSGTGLRLLAGIAASLPFLTVLVGDASVHRRPMGRIVEPLRAMGARIDGRRDGTLAPLVVRGGGLSGIDFRPTVPSAQVKSALLLAGLAASGPTTVRESTVTRRHTEELLVVAGASLRCSPAVGTGERDGAGDGARPGPGQVVTVEAGALAPFDLDVPGDPSQAAFLVVAAAIVPGSSLVVENVYVGPGRAGFVEVLRRMGASIGERATGTHTADLIVGHSGLVATEVGGAEIADCIDEIPVLAVAAAFAHGTTTFRDAGELRAKESDRIETTVSGLGAIGVRAEALPDGLVVHGTGGLVPPGLARGAVVSSHGDHRIAMAFAVAGLASQDAAGGVAIEDFEAVDTSWPGFLDLIEALRAVQGPPGAGGEAGSL